jgi:hypothetical protein
VDAVLNPKKWLMPIPTHVKRGFYSHYSSDVNKTFFQDKDLALQDQDQDQDFALQDQDQDLSSQDKTKTKTCTADAYMLKSKQHAAMQKLKEKLYV